jgi:hypothetical protein
MFSGIQTGHGSLDKGMVVSKQECDHFPQQRAKPEYPHSLKDRDGVVVPPNVKKERPKCHGAIANIAPSDAG